VYLPRAATVANAHFPYSPYDSYVAKSTEEKPVEDSDVKTTENPHRTNDEIIAINKKRVEIQKRKDDSGKMVD